MTQLAHQPIPRPKRSQVVMIVITAVLSVGLYFFLPPSISELQRRMLCVFVVAALFWAFEVLPLYATSLLVIAMMILFLATEGGLAGVLPGVQAIPEGTSISSKGFLAAFGSNIIILFMGGFLLSAALTKHEIDRAIAAKVIRPFLSSPMMLMYGVLLISAFFSMWMSNTATAAMMIAILRPILKQLPANDKYHRGLVLAVPFGANIGGVGTPIGTPPNAVAYAAINAAGGPGTITFLQWMMMGVPLALMLLVLVGQLLYRTHRPASDLALPNVEGPKRISWYGKLTLSILLATVALWLTGEWHGIGAGTVALLAAVALTALSVLDKYDVDSIDWNILILMWGGLAMGVGIEQSGLSDLVASADLAGLPGRLLGLAAVIVVLSIVLSTFMSNTATANLLVPIVLALSFTLEDKTQLAVLCALGCSFAMAMPVSTPPNAIAFATGEVRASTLFKLGGLVSIFSGIVLIAGYRIVMPIVLG
ncbi:MAG: DASS family sodium-coupled anion symporter [Planctomycetota bacterium]